MAFAGNVGDLWAYREHVQDYACEQRHSLHSNGRRERGVWANCADMEQGFFGTLWIFIESDVCNFGLSVRCRWYLLTATCRSRRKKNWRRRSVFGRLLEDPSRNRWWNCRTFSIIGPSQRPKRAKLRNSWSSTWLRAMSDRVRNEFCLWWIKTYFQIFIESMFLLHVNLQ